MRAAEVSWCGDLCNGDTAYIGTTDGERRSNYHHCRDIVLEAERLGFQNILLPSSYIVGQDTLAFAAAMAPQTSKINLLVAVRCGEVHPPMLARAVATLDHVLESRLTSPSSTRPPVQRNGEVR